MLTKYNRRTVSETSGAVIAGAIVKFYDQLSGSPATAYSDPDGVSPIGTSITSGAQGQVEVFLNPGLYRVVVEVSSVVVEELTYELLPSVDASFSPSSVGLAVVTLANPASDSYVRANADGTAESRTYAEVKTDLSYTTDEVTEGSTNLYFDFDHFTSPTVASLSSRPGNVGDVVFVSGVGGGFFDCVSSTGLSDDDGTILINGSIAWRRQYGIAEAVFFNPAGDGATNDSTKLNSAIALDVDNVYLSYGKKYLAPTFSNPLGRTLSGGGAVVKSVTGGLEQQNSYADQFQRVTGIENLAAWHKLVYDQHTTPTRALRLVFSGDSTTLGVGVDAAYTIPQLVLAGITDRGLQSPYNTTVINNGQSGAHTGEWAGTYVANDIADNPDLLIWRWGINDPAFLKSGSVAPANAGQSYPNRRDVADFAESLRNGLATFRASKDFATTSIILMTPNSTYDIPNARDAVWYEQIRGVVLQAARDFGCAFIDTYAYTQDSRYLANITMDDPYADGRGIHPTNPLNAVLAGIITDLIIPVGLLTAFSTNRFYNISGFGLSPGVSLAPSDWTAGLYIASATTVQGWPINGHVVTFRSADNTLLQYLFGYSNADRGTIKFRQGRAVTIGGEGAGWSSFYDLAGGSTPPSSTDVTPLTGYAQPGTGNMRVAIDGTVATIDGYITKSSPGAIAANTSIASFSVGLAPVRESAFCTATVWDGSVFQQVMCLVGFDGVIRISEAVAISVQRIYMQCAYSTLA